MPHHLELSTHGVDHLQPGAPNLMDSGDPTILTEQHHPVLQPTCQPAMCYPPQVRLYSADIQNGPSLLKLEKAEPEFRGHDLHISPVYMQPMDDPQSAPAILQQDSEHYHLPPADRFTMQYSPPHGFMPTETMHQYYFPLVGEGDNGSGMMQSQKPTPTRRGPFKDKEKRRETAATRKMGSCIRCRMQRIRVRPIMVC